MRSILTAATVLLSALTATASVDAATPTKPDRSLVNTYWKLTEVHGTPAVVPSGQREPHLILQYARQRIVGSGGCNRLTGTYALDGERIDVGQVAATRMACEGGMAQEQAFLRALDAVTRWRVQGDGLELRDDAGTALLRFVAVDLR
jgi:heat shock protein HslJ